MDWQYELISLYVYICKIYRARLQYQISRLSPHSDLRFSDEEVLTVYIAGILQKRYEVKDIHEHSSRHLREWFPTLPGYGAFVQRLNKVSHLFGPLIEALHAEIPLEFRHVGLPRLMDSMPIILAHRGRAKYAKVAPEIASAKGFCATKKLHYYGVKLHILGCYRTGQLPIPEFFGITEACVADIKAYEDIARYVDGGIRVFADKAYQTANQPIADKGTHTLFTPVKKVKRAQGQKSKELSAAEKLLSTAIATVRQPIESLFNWIEQKTHIQIASKVRSYNGLMVHVFGKIAAAFFALKLKLCS